MTRHIYARMRGASRALSRLERQAVQVGDTDFEKLLLKGSLRWKDIIALPHTELSTEEKEFLDGTARQLCEQLDDWKIRGELRAIPESIWDFMRRNKFFALRSHKEVGGLGFSAQAQSLILGMITSRSPDASLLAEVVNSLGPDELIEKYGTNEQKNYYLPRFRDGTEIPCFAVTSIIGGSDVASMPDAGEVCYGDFHGERVLGVKISWSKRYITLAPVATVITLAFTLRDPYSLLGAGTEGGITLALIPRNTPHIDIGRRHYPSGGAFPNGPISGTDVFVPLSAIIGGVSGVGKGWKMISECLASGRGVSLPSIAAASVRYLFRVTSAYSLVRRQFGRAIATFEGVQAPLGRLIEYAYAGESLRSLVASRISPSHHPTVISSVAKYQLTEIARKAILEAMDIHGGKAIIDGPKNYLLSLYQLAPIGITVEGANILTRSLIIPGQLVMRSHPFIPDELAALERGDAQGVREFDFLLIRHVWHSIRLAVSSWFLNLTYGRTIFLQSSPPAVRANLRVLAMQTAAFACVCDAIVLLLRDSLKKRQFLGGRISDMLSELCIQVAALQRFYREGSPTSDAAVIQMVLAASAHRFDMVLRALVSNMPWPLRVYMRVIALPRALQNPVPDAIVRTAVHTALTVDAVRDRLAAHTYVPDNAHDQVALLEAVRSEALKLEPLLHTLDAAVKRGHMRPGLNRQTLAEGVQSGTISATDAERLAYYGSRLNEILEVDSFPMPVEASR